MDFLTPTITQIRELFASMTAGARVTAGLLLAVVVVSLGFLFQNAAAGPDEYLFGGEIIGRDRLPRMEAAIAAADIEYTVEGNRLKVARGDRNAAVAAIASAEELPPEFHNLMKKALDGGHMFDFKGDKDQRYRAAREAQASLILSEFPWVDKANVIFNVRQTNSLRGGRKASAAVSIMPAVGESFDAKRMRTVRDYVSKACDVPMDQIAVTNLGSDNIASNGELSPEDFDHPFYKLKMQTELAIRNQIIQQLDYIPGVRVQVNAHLDPVSELRSLKVSPDKEAIALRVDTIRKSDEQTTNVPGDRVGVVAQGPEGVGQQDALARQQVSKEETNSSNKNSVVGTETVEKVTSGFALKEAEASVNIPMSFVEAVYRRENLDADGEEPETIDPQAIKTRQDDMRTDIEDVVKHLLPKLSLGQDEYAQVKVSFFRDLPPAPMPEPSLASGMLAWTDQYGSTLAMAGLAVFSLVMLRSMVRSGSKEGPTSGAPSLQLDGEALGETTDDEEEHERPKLKLRKSESLKDDLSEMVATDPDAAAAILKSWINNAA